MWHVFKVASIFLFPPSAWARTALHELSVVNNKSVRTLEGFHKDNVVFSLIERINSLNKRVLECKR